MYISNICASAVVSDGFCRRSGNGAQSDHRYRPIVALVHRNFHKLRPSSTFNYNEFNDISLLYPSFANHIQSVHDLGKLEVIILKKMDFGKDWANEKCTFGKGWDSEKMLQLYIYDRMRKRELYDAAEIFAKEANLEMLELVNSEEGLLKEWWNVFWPQFCSRMTNKAEARSSAQVPNYDVSGERSVQVESTCPAGQGSAYPPTAPNSDC